MSCRRSAMAAAMPENPPPTISTCCAAGMSDGLRRRAARNPLVARVEQEDLGGVGCHRHGARHPRVVVQIHIGVVLEVTAERAVEVPEPVGAEHVPARSPESAIALGLE